MACHFVGQAKYLHDGNRLHPINGLADAFMVLLISKPDLQSGHALPALAERACTLRAFDVSTGVALPATASVRMTGLPASSGWVCLHSG
jgi:hypothetical protein